MVRGNAFEVDSLADSSAAPDFEFLPRAVRRQPNRAARPERSSALQQMPAPPHQRSSRDESLACTPGEDAVGAASETRIAIHPRCLGSPGRPKSEFPKNIDQIAGRNHETIGLFQHPACDGRSAQMVAALSAVIVDQRFLPSQPCNHPRRKRAPTKTMSKKQKIYERRLLPSNDSRAISA